MAIDQVKPLGNRLLIKRSKARVSKGGIFLPDSAQEKPKEGEVLVVGPGKQDEKGAIRPMHVRKGDRVLFSSYAGSEVKTDDQDAEYLIMSEDDVLGILITQ